MIIYDSSEIRNWDAFTIKNEPISSIDLMERAATELTKHLLGSYAFESVDIICGVGNNGGDGLVVARLLNERGYSTRVIIVEFSEKYSPDFIKNLKRLPKGVEQIKLTEKEHQLEIKGDLIVDAIFGSGLNKPISGWIGNVTDVINASEKPTLSIDIPSGLFPSNNLENDLSYVVQATKTVSFQCPKMAFLYSGYSKYVGDFSIIDIGLSPQFEGKELAFYLTRSAVKLHKRKRFDHKAKLGYLTIIGGFGTMGGAAILASKAAFKTGSGYVGTLCAKESYPALMSQLPEAIWLKTISSKSTAIAIGPGLGHFVESDEILAKSLKSGLPLVIDADAITLIADNDDLLSILPENSILTPHIGELHQLLGTTAVDEKLLEIQVEFSKKHKVYIIQKGAYSKLTCPDGSVIVNSTGNPGMASAGMGDALTGIIGSLLSQAYSPEEAAAYGMYIHGLAGDLHTRLYHQEGMITSDLINMIPEALHAV